MAREPDTNGQAVVAYAQQQGYYGVPLPRVHTLTWYAIWLPAHAIRALLRRGKTEE